VPPAKLIGQRNPANRPVGAEAKLFLLVFDDQMDVFGSKNAPEYETDNYKPDTVGDDVLNPSTQNP
jgi:hypothetical protein